MFPKKRIGRGYKRCDQGLGAPRRDTRMCAWSGRRPPRRGKRNAGHPESKAGYRARLIQPGKKLTFDLNFGPKLKKLSDSSTPLPRHQLANSPKLHLWSTWRGQLHQRYESYVPLFGYAWRNNCSANRRSMMNPIYTCVLICDPKIH